MGRALGQGGDRWRRGMATGEVVLLLASAAVIGGLGVLVVPRAIEGATPGGPKVAAPSSEAARAVFDRVRMLIGSCVGLIGVWERDGGGVEIGLWHGDVREPGVVNADEVVLLSFSPVMGSVSAYLERGERAEVVPEGVEVEGGDEGPVLGEALDSGDLRGEGFPERWRGRAGIERHVIAGGLASMRVVRGGGASGGEGLETLRVELLWGPGGTDVEAEKGSFEVAVRRLDVER